jgi:phytoene desaturase
MKKIIVIGAGLGGLSASIYLANRGFEVEVYEMNDKPGGKSGEIKLKGYRFDTGPSLLTMPFVIEKIFQDSNENINDFLKIKELEVLTKYFYPDGTIINAFSDKNKFAEEVNKKTGEREENILNLLKYAKKIYDLTADVFIFNSLEKTIKFKSFFNINLLKRIFQIDGTRTMYNAIKSYINDPRIQQIFLRFATYNGSNPYLAPATLNVIAHIEHNQGAYYPEDGIYSIPNSLYKLAIKKGVKFNFNSKVDEILINENKAYGIKINGNTIPAECIISNVDVNTTYRKLINQKLKILKSLDKLELSSSVLVFNWGIKKTFTVLDIHNILFSKDYKKEFKEIFNEGKLPTDPTIYINISSKYNKNDAPEGCENWFVLINTPYNKDIYWENEALKAKKIILEKITKFLKVDIENLIECEEILSPKDIEYETGSYMGSLYGISSNTKTSAFRRHPSMSKEIRNLFFCGGSVHPGGGIPLVLESGRLVAEKISEMTKSKN